MHVVWLFILNNKLSTHLEDYLCFFAAYTTVIKSGLDLSHIEDFQSLSQELSQLVSCLHFQQFTLN